MTSFKEYLTPIYGMSFREVINELTDDELEERVQDYVRGNTTQPTDLSVSNTELYMPQLVIT